MTRGLHIVSELRMMECRHSRQPAAGQQQQAGAPCNGQHTTETKDGMLAPLTPLLPPALQALYTSVKRQEADEWQERMQARSGVACYSGAACSSADVHGSQELEKYAGPECARHVPSHALDASGCRAAYPPELLGIY